MPKTRPRYPAAFRQQTIELVQAGKTPAELSCEFGCSAQTILNWVRQSALRPCPEAAWPYQAIPRGQSSPAFAPARRRCPAFSRRLACALRQRRTRYPHVHAQAKDSGCFRTVTGVESFCTIRSYLATLRKQGRNVFHILTLAFQGQAPDPLPSG